MYIYYMNVSENKGLNSNLNNARINVNDEFYTRYEDIEIEIEHYVQQNKDVFRDKIVLLPCDDYEWSNFTKYFNDNFERFGIKKLISTCYTEPKYNLFDEFLNPNFDDDLEASKGKIFVRDNKGISKGYLDGDGDFRSKEIGMYRDEADVIITNPPFSLFRVFMSFLENKKFIVIGSVNAVTYKEVFPLIKENKMWLGGEARIEEYITPSGEYKKIGNTCWFTNIKHNVVKPFLKLKTMEENIKDSIKEYIKYDNYDAIEVSKTKEIPSDYEGVMAVPVTFINKYNPEQFEIVNGLRRYAIFDKDENIINNNENRIAKHMCSIENGKRITYFRIVIKHKKYQKYDNYDAIEVSRVKDIPCDYDGVMGVPITFLYKYNPEQFEVVGATESEGRGFSNGLWDSKSKVPQPMVNGVRVYKRLFVKNK